MPRQKLLFRSKRIHELGEIGIVFTRARQALGLSIETVATQINLDPRFLDAIEQNNFTAIPGKLYALNFIRTYARALGIASGLPILEQRLSAFYTPELTTTRFEKVCTPHRFAPSGRLHTFAWSIAVGVFLLFIIVQVISPLAPPQVVIHSPSSPGSIVIRHDTLIVTGTADPHVQVEVNGTPASRTTSFFEQKLPLLGGLNHITVTGKNRLGRTTTANLFVYYDEAAAIVLQPAPSAHDL